MSFITDTELRSYLLGSLADAPREEIEDTLLVSDEGLLRLEMAEEDLIEEFLDNELNQEQRAQFESQFLCTKARKEKLAYLQAIRAVAVQRSQPESISGNVVNFVAPQTQRSFFPFIVGMNRSGYLKLAAAILLVSSVGFWVWRYAFRPPQSASLVALNRAYAGGRTLETRIGGLDFAPYAPTRGANDADTNARILRERAERIVLDAYAEHSTAANRHALGKYYLADKQFDKAIEQFNAALKETPNAAELHNDLGAALLEKSKFEKRNNQPGESLEHMAASLESIEQALKLQPNYPAAVFNRALCLQEMYLPRQAIEEWKKYLQLDGNSQWADEARRRLAELEKLPSNISKSDDELYQDYLKDPANDERTFDLFCQSYSTTGNGITERLIDSFLAAKERRDEAEATRKLQLLEKLGALIYQRTTDPYVRDVARYYQQMAPSRQSLLVKARHHLNEGRKLRSTSQSKAAANYEQAIALFRQAQDQCEVKMTTCLLARSHLRQSNLDRSRQLFEELAGPGNDYLWLCGESLNGLAEYYERRNQPDESIRRYHLALKLTDFTNNTNSKLDNFAGLAFLCNELGDWERTLTYLQMAFSATADKAVAYQQAWAITQSAADNFFVLSFQSAAIAYQQEVLRIEQITKHPLQLSRSKIYLGAILGKDSRFTEAISLAEEAVRIGAVLENEQLGLSIQAYSSLVLAELQRKSGNYFQAILNYNRAIHLSQKLSDNEKDFEIYRGKALAEIAQGDILGAKQDLAHALGAFELNRNKIFAEKERTTYFDKEYEIYDAAIGFAYDDNPVAAFDLSEKGRARSLLELLKVSSHLNASQTVNALAMTDQAQPLSGVMTQKQMPRGTSLLEFTCLPDRLLVWGISAKGFTHNQINIPLSLLEQKVQAFTQTISGKATANTKQPTTDSAELYQLLMEPLEPFLAGTEIVCIVPDKVLYHLPFAALFSARRQKYLIEDYAIVIAPSASVFLLCSERARRNQSRANDRLLAVGNPHFDQTAYPQLSDLTAAVTEANDIGQNYEHHRILLTGQATEGAVKAEIKTASIIHLATHGFIDERSSANSRLLLTKSIADEGEDGALRAYEIARMRLPSRLAVLSACQSGVERFYRGEGLVGLSRAFLAAGVPTVVASSWTVDSEVTASLMINFHQQFRNHSASQALRRAQLKQLQNVNSPHNHPYYWAGFSTFGGDAMPYQPQGARP